MPHESNAKIFAELVRSRRSVRDFLPDPIPEEPLNAVLGDSNWSPSWSNTQPYRVAVACGEVKDRIETGLCERFDIAMKAQQGGLLGRLKLLATRRGLPDGDFATNFEYPKDLLPQRRATGHGLYKILGIGRHDTEARNRQLRRNFEFFGAPTVIFIFVHAGLHEFSVLDAGIFLQTLMLSAHANGLATCAQGALATWAGPVRKEFAIPKHYRLICGLSIGYASASPVNLYNPGRLDAKEMLLSA